VPVKSAFNAANEHLLIYVFTSQDEVADTLQAYLAAQRYDVVLFRSQSDFLATIQRERHHVDCLILYEEARLPTIVSYLQEQSLLLPTLIPSSPPRWSTSASITAALPCSGSVSRATADY
jgi:hypothetical protein